MDQLFPGEQGSSYSPLLAAVKSSRRRRILQILADRVSPVDEEELAIRLAAAERETSLQSVRDEEVQSLRADLRHHQLPMLEKVGLIARDGETVTTTDHRVFEDRQTRQLIEAEDDGWDSVIDCLAAERRRIVLAVLEGRTEPMARADLAREVARRESTGEPSDDEVKTVLVSLHHVHLPKLANAGLVEYNGTDEPVSYRGHPELEVESLDLESTFTVRDCTENDV